MTFILVLLFLEKKNLFNNKKTLQLNYNFEFEFKKNQVFVEKQSNLDNEGIFKLCFI